MQFENAEICPNCGVRLQNPPQLPTDSNIDPETGVNLETKKYIAILVWILTILGLLANPVFAIIASLAGWYWWAPYLAKYAVIHNKNPTWAFFIGAIFGIIGIIVYWIWEYLTR